MEADAARAPTSKAIALDEGSARHRRHRRGGGRRRPRSRRRAGRQDDRDARARRARRQQRHLDRATASARRQNATRRRQRRPAAAVRAAVPRPCCSTRRAAPPERSARIPSSSGGCAKSDLPSFAALQRELLASALELASETSSTRPARWSRRRTTTSSTRAAQRDDFDRGDVAKFVNAKCAKWVEDGVLRLTPESGADGFHRVRPAANADSMRVSRSETSRSMRSRPPRRQRLAPRRHSTRTTGSPTSTSRTSAWRTTPARGSASASPPTARCQLGRRRRLEAHAHLSARDASSPTSAASTSARHSACAATTRSTPTRNVYVRKIVVRNLRDERAQVKLFFHHDFELYGNPIGDTAMFDPDSRSVIHYKAKRYFLINGATDADAASPSTRADAAASAARGDVARCRGWRAVDERDPAGGGRFDHRDAGRRSSRTAAPPRSTGSAPARRYGEVRELDRVRARARRRRGSWRAPRRSGTRG